MRCKSALVASCRARPAVTGAVFPPPHVSFQDLAVKLLELVAVAPLELQRDIITSLPEILEDSQHGDIAQELK